MDGKMQKVNLCDACSKEKGVTDPTGFALADLLLGLGAAQEIERGGGTQKCPACGLSQADFKKSGRFGCPRCYDTFADGLAEMLKPMHRGMEHVGKVPARLWKSMQRTQEIRALQDQLDLAVAEENYESAAEIRDKLRQLETQET
ncbi:MAG: UvrB/UvrC motif-containing protein [Chthoniobacteraceae bacterium]